MCYTVDLCLCMLWNIILSGLSLMVPQSLTVTQCLNELSNILFIRKIETIKDVQNFLLHSVFLVRILQRAPAETSRLLQSHGLCVRTQRNGSWRSTVSLAIFTELYFLFKHTHYTRVDTWTDRPCSLSFSGFSFSFSLSTWFKSLHYLSSRSYTIQPWGDRPGMRSSHKSI